MQFVLSEKNKRIVKEFTDSEILECLRARQSYVVKYLSDRYIPMIRLLVSATGGTNEDAQDIFQDGLIIMLEKIDNKDFVLTCKFKTYLYCVCEHLWKTVIDKRKAASNYFTRREEDEYGEDISDSLDNQMYKDIFAEVFETLDTVSKTILKMHWQDASPQEIADKLGYTYNYVRKKKSKAQGELTDKVKLHPGYIKIMKTENAAKEVVH